MTHAEMWAGFAWASYTVAVDGADDGATRRSDFPRTVSLPAAYGMEGAEAFTILAPGAATLADAIEPLFRAWRRAGLTRGVLPGPDEAEGLLDALRLQLATARGAPDAPLWQGVRGAEPRWVLDLAAFVEPSGDVATAALARAVGQAMTALELAGPHGPERAVAVVPANLAAALMAAGMPYAAAEARATAAALMALVLGTAVEASAGLARRLSACPAWIERRSAVLATLEAAFDRLPPGAPAFLAADAAAALDRGLAAARRHGLRQLGLVALSGPGLVERLLGTDSVGTEPMHTLVRHAEDRGGRLARVLARPAQRAIGALGLSPEQEREAVAAIIGHGRLAGAPESAIEALLETGLDPVELAPYLPGAVSLAHAAALADPAVTLPDSPALAALDRYAIGTGTAAEAPHLPPAACAALATGASQAARAAMADAVSPFLGLGLAAAQPRAARRRAPARASAAATPRA
jgi:hypothetical protein